MYTELSTLFWTLDGLRKLRDVAAKMGKKKIAAAIQYALVQYGSHQVSQSFDRGSAAARYLLTRPRTVARSFISMVTLIIVLCDGDISMVTLIIVLCDGDQIPHPRQSHPRPAASSAPDVSNLPYSN